MTLKRGYNTQEVTKMPDITFTARTFGENRGGFKTKIHSQPIYSEERNYIELYDDGAMYFLINGDEYFIGTKNL